MAVSSILLASASPRRAQLLEHLGWAFKVMPAAMPEVQSEFLSPREGCQLNAYRKARWVAKQYPDALVIGADTIVCLNDRVLGKPRNAAEAQAMLTQLQGQTHQVLTGVCLLQLRRHRQQLFSVRTLVTLRPLDRDQIAGYLKRINPLDKAGGYAIQEYGDMIVDQVQGSLTNVIGLPLAEVERELRALLREPASRAREPR